MPVITGTSGSDTIYGTPGADQIYGLAGSDVIYGGGGDDFIDGGAGNDVAGYGSLRRQYVASSTSVSGHGDGTDTLVGIETVRFTDGVLVFSPDSIAAKVARMFQTGLGREIDPRTLDLFGYADISPDPRATQEGLAFIILRSDEYSARFGGLSDAQFVAQLYKNAFVREPAAWEVALWVQQLNIGASRAQILVEISDSAEARQVWAADAARGYWVGNAVGELLASLYDSVFNRLPDVDGFNTWMQQSARGQSINSIVNAFLISDEYRNTFGDISNSQFVAQTYRFAFGREGDVAGAAEWVRRLDAGWSRADMINVFIRNGEAIEHSRPIWEGGVRYLGSDQARIETIWHDADAVPDNAILFAFDEPGIADVLSPALPTVLPHDDWMMA